ncbi:MAG: putative bifunctional diguanylate cyclase/phosphodiesterase [Bacillota bacterium]
MFTSFKQRFKYFFIPFITLMAIFAILTYIAIVYAINTATDDFENEARQIANVYSDTFAKSNEAYETISYLLRQKLTLASQGINEAILSDDTLSPNLLAKQYLIDDLHFYNNDAEIILSNVPEYVGWTAPVDHPVYNFMISDKDFLIEDIRKDSESDRYYKYAYLRQDDKHFLQIGILAENMQDLLKSFEVDEMIDDITATTDVAYLSFISHNFNIIASNAPEMKGARIEDTQTQERLRNNTIQTIETTVNGAAVYQVCVPVYNQTEKIGNIAVAWPRTMINQKNAVIVVVGVSLFLLVSSIGVLLLLYTYRLNQKNMHSAYYDTLTDLPNKTYLTKELDEQLKKTYGERALLLINCSNFKLINTTYGFNYGDELLKKIAQRLQSSLRDHEQIFRFTADRFVIIINGYDAKVDLYMAADRVLQVFNTPFVSHDSQELIQAQVGIVELSERHHSSDDVLKEASLALAHQQENTAIYFYEDELERVIKREETILHTLRQVIAKDDTDSFSLHYQPKVDVSGEKVVGFEALARLKIASFDKPNISPVEFIQLAEANFIIYDLGLIIIEHACHFYHTLKAHGHADTRIAINISGLQLLRDEFEDDLTQIIRSTGADPHYIVLEITESIWLNSYEQINDKLKRLKAFGFSIDLDDFGTGFSSFSSIAELNIDRVKIDQIFINKIQSKEDDAALVSDIISMCHKVGLEVIAEGVETQEQLAYLKLHQADIAQGYYFSKPLPEPKALRYLRNL